MKNRLKTIQKSGKTISEAEIQEMYDFRRSIFEIKEHMAAKDFKKFHQYAYDSQYIYLFRDEEGELKGIHFCKYKKVKKEGKTIVLLEPEYGFIAREYRRSGILSKAFLWMTFKIFLKHPIHPIYFIGLAYPASYLLLRKEFGRVLDASSEDFLPYEKTIFEDYQQKISAENSAFVENSTIPEASPEFIEGYQKNPDYEYYRQLNPNWDKGYGLIILSQILVKQKIIDLVKNKLRGKTKKRDYL